MNKDRLLSHNLTLLAIELFDVDICPLQIWIKPWTASFTLIGIESGNIAFHVFYIEYTPNSKYFRPYEKKIKFEIFGIKNFKYE